jgi:hypothetical protein
MIDLKALIIRYDLDLDHCNMYSHHAVVFRDAELSGLRSEIHEALGNRNLADEHFKNSELHSSKL